MSFTVTMPKLSPTMEEGNLVKWHVKVGDKVVAGQLLFEVSTDKATIEYNALDEGFLRKILVKEGENAEVNQPVAIFTEKANETFEETVQERKVVEREEKKIATQVVREAPQPVKRERVVASPLAKKLAEQQNIDLTSLQGTGPGGRILSRDLVKSEKKPSMPAGTYEEEPMTPIRKVIAKRLLQAKQEIPHYYETIEVDASPIVRLREELSAGGVKVTFNDLIISAVALALREHPQVNSGYDAKRETILRYLTVDIAVAVNTPDGLITPIIKQADRKRVTEISEEVKQLSEKAKQGKLAPHEFQGGSFTISNLGMFGISQFQGIINPPQGALLAVGGILDKPVVKEGAVVAGKVMALTLSADHRIIDGALAAQFLVTLQKILTNPSLLLV